MAYNSAYTGAQIDAAVGAVKQKESTWDTAAAKANTALQSFTETDPTVPSWAKQATKPSYTADEVGAAASSHTQAASTITAGTFSGMVNANATAAASVGTAQVRDISAGTIDLIAGSSALATGSLYLVYE